MDGVEAARNYRSLAEGALSWVTAQLDLFELPQLGDPELVDKLKPFGELVVTLDVVCEHSRGHEANTARELLEWAWDQTAQGSVLERIVLEHHELVYLCCLYEIFRRRVRDQPGFRSLIEGLVKMRSVRGLELIPWRELELATCVVDVGIESPWSREACLQRTWLAALPEPWEMNVSFGYSVTHTVFYATRFGRTPSDLPAPMREYIAEWWPVWTRLFLREENLDLVAELVMAARCIGLADEERLDQRLLGAQRADGLIPGPVIPGAAPAVNGSRQEQFAANYHTTLVGLMAGAMSSG